MTDGWNENQMNRPENNEVDVPWGVPYLLPAMPSDNFGNEIPDGVYQRPAAKPRTHGRYWIAAAAVTGVLAIGGVSAIGVHIYDTRQSTLESQSIAPSTGNTFGGGSGGTSGGSSSGNSLTPNQPDQGFGAGPGSDDGSGFGSDGGTSSTSQSTALATAAEQVGVVDINTTLGLEGGQAAGTGMIITSDGEVLTNNHVIKGATAISVTVVSTGKTYTAKVLGYSKTNDVALLQLQNASNLTTIKTSTSVPSVGTSVVGVGNAGGAGGTPSAAAGKVVALDQDITATDAGGGDAENVSGLIQTDAPIAAGDSGGPLFTTDDAVVGMDTAAGSNGGPQGYAIPIAHALAIAHQIEAGNGSSTVHIGSTAFLGVGLQDNGGAQITNVVSGTPAASVGLAAGDIITEFNGHTITKSTDLMSAVAATSPGNSVSIHWTDSAGASHSATVTLASGPSL